MRFNYSFTQQPAGTILQGSGTACGLTTADDGGEFTLEIGAPDCPAAAGKFAFWGHLRSLFPLQALGPIVFQMDVYDEWGAHMYCIEVNETQTLATDSVSASKIGVGQWPSVVLA